jgi:hypothetical protein
LPITFNSSGGFFNGTISASGNTIFIQSSGSVGSVNVGNVEYTGSQVIEKDASGNVRNKKTFNTDGSITQEKFDASGKTAETKIKDPAKGKEFRRSGSATTNQIEFQQNNAGAFITVSGSTPGFNIIKTNATNEWRMLRQTYDIMYAGGNAVFNIGIDDNPKTWYINPSLGTGASDASLIQVSQSGDVIIKGKLTAKELHTEFTSASIIYESGSTQFGDTLDDTHDFSGSFNVVGNITASGNITSSLTSTASFGHFIGNGSGLTNVSATLPANVVSSSAQIASDISGSFNAASSSFSTRVAANEVITARALVSSSAQIASDISGSSTSLSSSLAGRVKTNETKLATIETNADVTDTSNVTSAGALMDSELSEIATVKALTKAGISGSLGSNASLIRSLTAASISGSFTTASSSFSTRVAANEVITARALVSSSAGHITASGNISASGIVYGSQGYFESNNGTLLTLERNSDQNAAIVFKNTNGTMVAGIDEDIQNNGANIFGIGYYGDLIDNDGQNHATFVVTGSQVVINNATSASSGYELTVGGDIHATGNISASGTISAKEYIGNISSSGDLYGSNLYVEGGKVYGDSAYNNYLNFNNSSSLFVIQNKTYVKFDGSNNQREVTVNEGTNDIDFNVKGNANEKVFFVDAGTEKIGMHGVETPTAGLHIEDDLWVSGSNGHITASGNISASGGTIIGNRGSFVTQVSTPLIASSDTTEVHINDNLKVTGHITASGNISASGTITMLTASIGGGIFTSASLAGGGGGAVSAVANGSNNRVATFSSADALNGEANLLFDGSTLEIGGKLKVSSNITASSNISASGNISASTISTIGDITMKGASTKTLNIGSTTHGSRIVLDSDVTSRNKDIHFKSGGSTKHIIEVFNGNMGIGGSDSVDTIISISGSGNANGKVGINTPNSSTDVIPEELTVEGNISASGHLNVATYANMLDVKHFAYYISSTSNGGVKYFLPQNSLSENSTGNPFNRFFAPYDGVFKKVIINARDNNPGNTTVSFHTGSANANPINAVQSISRASLVDDTAYEFNFSSSICKISKGDHYSVAVQGTNTVTNYWHGTWVIEYDTST